jgi:hypothetical protein
METPQLNIVVDSDADPAAVAEFLATLNDIYAELSDGDELVINEVATSKQDSQAVDARPIHRQGTIDRALAKGRFATGYLGVFGRYSKRHPKGAPRPTLPGPDGTADWRTGLAETVDALWRQHQSELAAQSSQPVR